MPTMYDAVDYRNIPTNPPPTIVAGYIDGRYAWPEAAWSAFPGAYLVHIATSASTMAGEVLDVEAGDATPEEAPAWCTARRAAGVSPVVYTSVDNWATVSNQFTVQKVPAPYWWIASWDNKNTLIEGAIAKQYKNDLAPGYDVSVVSPSWPHSPSPTPTGGFDVSTMPTISQGSSGNVVKTAQACLLSKCAQHIVVDGVFGPATETATKTVQKFFGLTADGIIGSVTWGALLLL